MLMRLKSSDPVLDFLSGVALRKYPSRRRLERRDICPLGLLDWREQSRWFAVSRGSDGICRKGGVFSSDRFNRQRFSRDLRPSRRYRLNECL